MQAVIIFLKFGLFPSPKAVNIAVSRDNIDTKAATRLIIFEADITGLLYFLYRIKLTTAVVKTVKV